MTSAEQATRATASATPAGIAPEGEALLARYEAIFETVQPPFAFVDLDALRENARRLRAQAGGLPIRVASKSLRSVSVLRRVLELDPGFRGVLAFTLSEALWLVERGFDDIVVAYPTADREAISELAALAADGPERTPVLMVDDYPHLDLIEATIGSGRSQLPVCLDLDVSWWPLRGRLAKIGPKRSPVHYPWKARKVAADIVARPGTKLVGAMAYEGQIAGVGDRIAGKPLRSLAIRTMQRASAREIARRLPKMIDEIRGVLEAVGAEPLRFINGGGTGSLGLTARTGVVTELTAGSGFYCPALFDQYRSLDLIPAAFFVLPVVRRPAPEVATVLGGGLIASGQPGEDRLPTPWLPQGLRFDKQESAGEVQTPLVGAAAKQLRIGDRVYLRHAKAGELCERFESLYLVEGERIVDEAPTYRGEGRAFL